MAINGNKVGALYALSMLIKKSENNMAIKPQEINRCEHGFWTHADFPDFDGAEHPTDYQIDKWLSDNNINFRVFWFESDAEESLLDRYFDDGDLSACAEWNPVCDSYGAFLISIHDTEDGPVAIFAIPNKGE